MIRILLPFFFPLAVLGQTQTLYGPARVIDGDTLKIGSERVRMVGIDAPETKQSCKRNNAETWPCGEDSSLALIRKIAGRNIRCEYQERDRYRRILGTCYADGVNLSGWMVRQGWALAYRRYSKVYVREEEKARADGVGIWSGEFTEPWTWRRRRK